MAKGKKIKIADATCSNCGQQFAPGQLGSDIRELELHCIGLCPACVPLMTYKRCAARGANWWEQCYLDAYEGSDYCYWEARHPTLEGVAPPSPLFHKSIESFTIEELRRHIETLDWAAELKLSLQSTEELRAELEQAIADMVPRHATEAARRLIERTRSNDIAVAQRTAIEEEQALRISAIQC